MSREKRLIRRLDAARDENPMTEAEAREHLESLGIDVDEEWHALNERIANAFPEVRR